MDKLDLELRQDKAVEDISKSLGELSRQLGEWKVWQAVGNLSAASGIIKHVIRRLYEHRERLLRVQQQVSRVEPIE